jgi:hypothetical protein
MKTIHIFLLVTAVCALLVGVAPKTAVSKAAAPAVTVVDDVSAAANQELAAVRRATEKYHDFQQAVDDGYVQVSACVLGEGFHHRQPSLFNDCVFDPEHPEILHYLLQPNGEFKLIAVEYLVRKSCPGLATQPPEGFSGDADVWFSETPGGVPVWALNAWIWSGNPDGVFAPVHTSITCD